MGMNPGVTKSLLDQEPTLVDSRHEVTGQTPLMFAASSGNASLVNLLLSKGADVNAKNKGKTAMDFAKKPEIKQMILEHSTAASLNLPTDITRKIRKNLGGRKSRKRTTRKRK